MILVKTYLHISPIHGVGVFAAEPIAAGTLLWRFVEGIDRVITEAEMAMMPEVAQAFVREYGYCCPHFPGGMVLSADNARFLNHADAPNTDNRTEYAYAKYDIAVGEEMTCDYRELSEEYAGLPYVGVSRANVG